ncbi:MAG: DUF167 domain-containing protein [Desulfurococcales archaeon]|nr:DUF167 domain-containing protein [Desulfurococcales archaeon]
MPVNPSIIRKLVEPGRKGPRIRVYVKPGSTRVSLVLEEDELVFYTDEPPIEGRANASLIRFMARALGVNPRAISIVSGVRGRLKVLEVEGLGEEELVEALASVAEAW